MEAGCERKKKKIIEINNGESHRVLELAMEAGRILLRNGAEIFRVEETVWHICEHYGVQGLDTICTEQWDFYHSR